MQYVFLNLYSNQVLKVQYHEIFGLFFINQPHMGPWFMAQNIFDFHLEFTEIF